MTQSEEPLHDLLRRLRTELPVEISAGASRLETLILRFDPLDLLASATLHELFREPEQPEKGQQLHVEYLTMICLSRAYWRPSKSAFDPEAFNEVIGLVEQICRDTMWYYAAEIVDPQADVSVDLHRLRVRSIVNELYVRNPAYYHHVEDYLTRLLSVEPFISWMRRHLGFDPNGFFICVRSIISLLNKRFESQRIRARTLEADLVKELATDAEKGETPAWLPADATTAEGRIQLVRNECAVRMSSELGKGFSFTAEDLSTEAGLAIETVRAVLEAFSLEFGSVPSTFKKPSIGGPLHERPLVRHLASYMCPVPHLLPWALRPLVERALNPERSGARESSSSIWDAYQKTRARFLVTEGLRYFKNALPTAQCYQSLRYELLDDGKRVHCELDGLVVFDGSVFLIEAKAGGFRMSARRGGTSSIAADLRALLEKPYRQALRARNYVLGQPNASFTLSDGLRVELARDEIRQAIPITLTLEPLDTFVANLDAVREIGIGTATEPHWAVQIFDLRVICELLEWPSQMVHYLFRRLRLNDSDAFHAHDELDWFAQYLRAGLYFDDVLSSGEFHRVSVLGTEEIDNYYAHQTGQRATFAPKPAQPMPPTVRQVLNELAQKGGTAHTEAMRLILDCGAETKQSIADQLDRIRAESRRDGLSHNASIKWSDHLGAAGITLISYTTAGVSPRELMIRLQRFVEIKKYDARASRWLGIATLADVAGLAHAWILAEGDWEIDPEMEIRVQEWQRLQS